MTIKQEQGKPETQEEWTVHSLNIHGAFFERRCAALIAQTQGWKVLAHNYPVEFPPPNGFRRGKESAVDIWARKGSSALFVDVLVECKKANPEFVNWVLFPKPGVTSPTPFTFARSDNEPSPAGDATAWASKIALVTGLTDAALVNEAREVRGDYSKIQDKAKTKTANAAIQEAAYQIALGARSIVNEDGALLGKACKSPDHPSPPWVAKLYVPIIVTTARLFLARYNIEQVALDTGEIDLKGVAFEPVQSALYEYPLPKHLQHAPIDPLSVLKTGNSDLFSRMHIFIVHSEYLEEFLRTLFAEDIIASQHDVQPDSPASGGTTG